MSDPHPQGDRIILTGLVFYGYHGVMHEENRLGQRFKLDIECGLDLSRAGHSDEVTDTVSYDHIYTEVKKAVEDTRFKLIEALAQHIIDTLFETFPNFDWLRVRLRKPEAPVPTVTGEFAIELLRHRSAG